VLKWGYRVFIIIVTVMEGTGIRILQNEVALVTVIFGNADIQYDLCVQQ